MTILDSHKDDKVFDSLREGMTVRLKVLVWISEDPKSDMFCKFSSGPSDPSESGKAPTWREELEALKEKDLVYVPVPIAEIPHVTDLDAALESIMNSGAGLELDTDKREA
eukprot:12977739-Alexandrium_andersonii.AAC.1